MCALRKMPGLVSFGQEKDGFYHVIGQNWLYGWMLCNFVVCLTEERLDFKQAQLKFQPITMLLYDEKFNLNYFFV